MAIGMALPGVSGNWSPAGQALFGRNDPANQVPNETEEEKRRRLAALQAAQSGITARMSAGYGAALGSYSPAGQMLFAGTT